MKLSFGDLDSSKFEYFQENGSSNSNTGQSVDQESSQCSVLEEFPKCSNYQKFKNSITNVLQKQVNTIVDTLNTIPDNMVKNSIENTKRVGHKLWIFGDLMAGTDGSQAPVTREYLHVIDQIYLLHPELVPILIERSKILKQIPIQKRAEYILANKFLSQFSQTQTKM